MTTEVPIRIVLIKPPPSIVYGVQRGKGADYEVVSPQRLQGGDLTFDFAVRVAEGKDGTPNFLGEFVQGPVGRRFVYVDVGRYAGQHDTEWARRMILRLDDVTWAQIEAATKPRKRLEARIPGAHADGGPNCATVKPIGGWQVKAVD